MDMGFTVKLLVNIQSGRAAVQVPAPSLMLDDGTVERRVRLLRPMERPAISLGDLAQTHWREADRADFVRAWDGNWERARLLHSCCKNNKACSHEECGNKER